MARVREKIEVVVFVLGRDPQKVQVRWPATVGAVLRKLNLRLKSDESILVRGRKRSLDFSIRSGDALHLCFPIVGEATVKCNGDKWRLHKNDQDRFFPSDFHAHNENGSSEVLDLYTGNIFDSRTRLKTRVISRRCFQQVRTAFGDGQPPANLLLERTAAQRKLK